VTLTVTDNAGAQASASATATISNRLPVANAGGPYSAQTGTAVQFNGSGSSDPDGTITNHSWNFGDNTTGTGATPTHAYASSGAYTVTLTVTDNNGTQASATSTATISAPSIPTDGHANLSYDTATNRITNAGFAYDAAGNQVRALIPGSSNSQRFQYDAANRLVKVKADDNVTVIASYTYGSSNERLVLEEVGVRTYYACDGSAEYTETDSSVTPQWSKTYIYLSARLLSTLTPNGSGGQVVQYHHPDRLGTRLVTNAQDTNYFEQQTLPFGTALNESPPAGAVTGFTNRRFTTYDRSLNTGLDYAINRHYDPQQGRFTQVDPIGMSAASPGDPQSLNMYAYCGNDPVNNLDPEGLFWGKLKRFFKKILPIINAVLLTIVAILAPNPSSISYAVSAWIEVFGSARLRRFARIANNLTQGFNVRSSRVAISSPPWNPNATGSRGFGGFGWDDDIDVITTTTNCRNNYPLPDGPNCPGASWLRELTRGIRTAQEFTAGAIDEGMLFGRFYRGLLGGGGEENSRAYSNGRWTVFFGTIIIPGAGQGATAGHIFRNAIGHVNPVTLASKTRYLNLFGRVASDPANLRTGFNLSGPALGAGISVYTKVFRNGKQVWVYVRNDRIVNAGVNLPGAHR
jgi:RHS repeat-associated protein